jgi:hypothetical protein
MANHFRDPVLHKQYEAMFSKYHARHADLFTPEGVPHNGGQAFWLGYQGKTLGTDSNAVSKKTAAYASWRAGQDCRQAEGDAPRFA